MKDRYIVEGKCVETLKMPWGTFQWMNTPAVTGSDRLTFGTGLLKPGQGHARHCHEGMEEVLYFLEGEAEQVVELPDGTEERRMIGPNTMVHLPADTYHSTMNTGTADVRFIAIYEHTGPETDMRADKDCVIIPPETD